MRRTSLQFLDDILEAIGNIEEDTGGISFEEFSADRRRRDAVIRNFQVIGEAIKNLPPELRERYPDTDWKKRTPTGKKSPDSAMSSPMSG